MTKKRLHLYEGMYILSATLSEEGRKRALDRILDGITGREGGIHKIHEQGRRKFAYPINKKREGIYYLIYFSAFSPDMKEMWKEYHLNEDLIRFFTMRTDEVKETIEFKPLVKQ